MLHAWGKWGSFVVMDMLHDFDFGNAVEFGASSPKSWQPEGLVIGAIIAASWVPIVARLVYAVSYW